MSATAARCAPARTLARLGPLPAVLVLAILVSVFSSASAHAAGSDDVRVTANVAYGTDSGSPLVLDVYQPPHATSADPVVILIHGGGWNSGDKERYDPFARALAQRGFVVFNIDY